MSLLWIKVHVREADTVRPWTSLSDEPYMGTCSLTKDVISLGVSTIPLSPSGWLGEGPGVRIPACKVLQEVVLTYTAGETSLVPVVR